MFTSLLMKFALDLIGKAIMTAGTVAVTKGYLDQDTATTVTGALVTGAGGLITAGVKAATAAIANRNANRITNIQGSAAIKHPTGKD